MMKKMKKLMVLALTTCMMLTATTIFAEETPEIYETGFQISFITPLGTNGRFSHRTINTVSINLLGGYSYGNTGVEFGAMYNINTHLTKGVQFAGLFNFSGNADGAFQVAAGANISANAVGSQLGGLLNMAEDVGGIQVAAGANISANEVGSQVGGLLNMAENVGGAQVTAGINIAKKVNGIQFGLFNYAEEVDGVSIGLINIVKKGGKQEFEVAFSEVLTTAISFKLGTDKFYTIFSGGINYLPTSEVEYAYGLGFGTHIDWVQGWGNQIELLGYQLTKDGKNPGNFMNKIYQLKLTVSKEFAKHFKVFAGPILNLGVSNYKNPETGKLDSSIAPWSMWETEFKGAQLNSWVGFSVGVRF